MRLHSRARVFIFWALAWTQSRAEREYFLQPEELGWDDARSHCQRCFRDLVTVTPDNSRAIAKNLSADHWVGLRSNSETRDTGDPRFSWTRWADGDPLAFQNWYPGSLALARNCSTANDTATCEGWLDTGAGSEDSCVAMLSFGAWVERSCSERLPYICYEDRFHGRAEVFDVMPSSTNLKWLTGPGEISHYRVEVAGDEELTSNQDGLTHSLVGLTPGTRYSVRVFPVKCGRDLNPQTVTFYTKPNRVDSHSVSNVTQNSVFLTWSKPAGNVDFYLIRFLGKEIESCTEGAQVGGLTPGERQTVTIRAGVKDKSVWSEEHNVNVTTKPGKVSNVVVSKNTHSSMMLTWVNPEGRFDGFMVKATNDSDGVLFSEELHGHRMQQNVTGLPMGTRITLGITVLADDQEGDEVTVVNYTAPEHISKLILNTSHDTLSATWSPPAGNYSFFTVELQLEGKCVDRDNTSELQKGYRDLKTAANYTVVVTTVSGLFKSNPVKCSMFTLPSAPVNVTVAHANKSHITVQWVAPANIERAVYVVNISSGFWGYSSSVTVKNITSHTFGGLKSGTRYQFAVHTKADRLSRPATVSEYTEAEKREITLSMLCSSQTALLCDSEATRQSVFRQLHSHFKGLLRDSVFWELEEREAGNPGTEDT